MTAPSEALSFLPAKTRVPVERLLEKGLIDQETVETALSAVTHAGQPDRLLPFMTAVLFLRSQGVSVRDTVAMARSFGRAVRLDWSPGRWKQEHDRLSRLSTLNSLSAKAVTYELCAYRALLPPSWPGYLISTSRRLGYEGLWQQHCVASYHERIVNGACAIVVVFIDRQRFTVELTLTGSTERPLRIVQCKSRLNADPTAQQRAAIRGALGIKEVVPAANPQCAPMRDGYLPTLRILLPVLRDHGVSQVHVEFDGSGDSGQVDQASFEPSLHAASILVDLPSIDQQFVDDAFVPLQAVRRVSLQDAIDRLAEQYIDATGVDWFNSDGGHGSLCIDVGQGTIELNVYTRYTRSECEHSSTVDIETGADL
jgi:hypothetical protein